VMTMTDEEKSEASATDDRAREIVERTTGQAPGDLTRLHGAVRSFDRGADGLAAWETMLNPPADASPDEAVLAMGAVRIARGSRVRLQPQRRADSMDMFLAGRTAIVAGVYRDLEDRAHIAVTLDDDPGADLRRAYGRFFYFASDEVVPVEVEG
jgi:hypothetical protein